MYKYQFSNAFWLKIKRFSVFLIFCFSVVNWPLNFHYFSFFHNLKWPLNVKIVINNAFTRLPNWPRMTSNILCAVIDRKLVEITCLFVENFFTYLFLKIPECEMRFFKMIVILGMISRAKNDAWDSVGFVISRYRSRLDSAWTRDPLQPVDKNLT